MRRRQQASLRRVALWRHTSRLLVVSLLSLLLGQPFHERVATDARTAPAVVASGLSNAADGSPARAGDHDRDHCLQCRAVAQTRLGVRTAAYTGALEAQGPALALRDRAPERPFSAPERGLAAPRAPPVRLLVQHS